MAAATPDKVLAMFDGLASDFRYVLRVLRKSPGFTVVAVLSLAIGIGANVSMFGVVRTLLLQPLPVESPEELRLVTWAHDGNPSISQMGSTDYAAPGTGRRYRSNFSYPLARALAEAAPSGVDVFSFAFVRGVSVALGDQPALLAGGALADGQYFASLGAPMALGRPLSAADDVPGAPLVAVLSHSFWARAFGADPDALGRVIRVNGQPAEIIGVTADGFRGLSMGGFFPQTEITVPLAAQETVASRLGADGTLRTSEEVFWLRLMARLPQGASESDAERALESALRAHPSPLVSTDVGTPELRLLDGSQGAQPVRAETGRLLLLLLGVVATVLLIACVNLASLMLARSVKREREMAVRRALGGSRLRLVRQTLLECLVLAGGGTIAGVALSFATRGFLGDLLTSSLGSGAFGALVMEVDIDPGLIALSALLGLVATCVFGLAPALRLSGLDPAAWLKHKAAGAGTSRLTAGRALIALQIAVSVPLVVGAALLLRTVSNLGSVELGFDPRGLVSFQVDPGYTNLSEDEHPDLYLRILAAVRELPGVTSATVMENVLMGGIVSNGSVEVEGQRHMLFRNAIGPEYRETLGIQLVDGRMPGLQDDRNAPRVGVVNQTAVREMYGGQSPIGRTIGREGSEVRIVGVVTDTPYRDLRGGVPPTLYESALQRGGYGGHHIVMRTDVPAAQLEARVREVVHGIEADVPVPTLRSQTAVMAESSARERVFSRLLGLFGGFALLLASIGLHGVTAYSVARRTSEFGVRMAVGAQPRDILGNVLRQVTWLAAGGVAVGVVLAWASGRLVQSVLFGVAPTDPSSIVAASLVMMAVALGAGLIPAVRAARLDPLDALRTE